MGTRKKIIAGILIVILVAGYIGVKAYVTSAAEERVNRAIAGMAGFVDVDYKKVSVDLFGSTVHIRKVSISPVGEKEKAYINDIAIHDVDHKNKIPLYLHVAMNGIAVDTDSFGDSAKELKALGYDNVNAHMELDYKYDKDEKTFNLNTFRSGAEDMGTVDLKFHVSNQKHG